MPITFHAPGRCLGSARGSVAWGSTVLAAVLFAIALLPAAAAAQVLTGRVLEDGRETPVAGAAVALLDADGSVRVRTESDALGRFTLTPPEAGEFMLEAQRLGYRTTRSPLLALTVDGAASLDLVMTPQPIGLEGFEVTTERPPEELLAPYGLRREELGRRWIDRETIDAMEMPGSAGDVVAWQGLAGVAVDYVDGANGALCVRLRASGRCAITFLNGVHIDSVTAQSLDPHSLEAVAVLRPYEAAQFFGTLAPGGAVLLWTRSGRR